jgi:taurine--2-oxoglutarate transaminase
MGAVVDACKEHGILPFANFNRTNAVPHCSVSDAEIAEGLVAPDAALDEAHSHLVP